MLNLQKNRCTYVNKEGIRCNQDKIEGELFCQGHKITSLARGRTVYAPQIWEKLEMMKVDDTFESMDAEIAYLKTIPDRIEASPSIAKRPDLQIKMISDALNNITMNLERRREYMAKQSYTISFDLLRVIMGQMYSVLRRYIDDEHVLRQIGVEFSKIRVVASGGTDKV